MSRTRPTILLAGALAGALALAGCGAGQVANTSEQLSNAPGANVAIGPISVRDAVIVYGDSVEGPVHTRGDSAPLSMAIVNDGTEPDRLVSATSPFAQSVEVSGDAEISPGTVLFVEGESEGAAAGSSGAVTTPTVAPSAAQAAPSAAPVPPTVAPGAIPAPTATPAPAATPAPSGTAVAPEEVSIVLTGLTDDIRAGVSYPITLTFERAGQLIVEMPVDNPEEPREVSEDTE